VCEIPALTLSSDFMFFVGIFDKAFFAALHNRLCKEEIMILLGQA
jgi:hypothetical protein